MQNKQNIKKGDVVLCPFPFSDTFQSKVRPAIVVSDGTCDGHISLLFISSSSKHVYVNSPLYIELQPTTKNGLKTESFALISKINAVNESLIIGGIGQIENITLKAINIKIKMLYGL